MLKNFIIIFLVVFSDSCMNCLILIIIVIFNSVRQKLQELSDAQNSLQYNSQLKTVAISSQKIQCMISHNQAE